MWCAYTAVHAAIKTTMKGNKERQGPVALPWEASIAQQAAIEVGGGGVAQGCRAGVGMGIEHGVVEI